MQANGSWSAKCVSFLNTIVCFTVRMDFQPVLCYGRGVAPNSFLTSRRLGVLLGILPRHESPIGKGSEHLSTLLVRKVGVTATRRSIIPVKNTGAIFAIFSAAWPIRFENPYRVLIRMDSRRQDIIRHSYDIIINLGTY